MRLRRSAALAAVSLFLMVVIAACGSSSSKSSSSASSSTTSSAAVASGTSSTASATKTSNAACIPAAPTKLPGDPDGVAASLTGVAKAALGGYPGTVHKSPWVNFKPKHGPPWTIGVSENGSAQYEIEVGQGIKQWAAAHPGLVKKVIVTDTSTSNDIPGQIQQMQSLLQQHVDIMFSSLSSSTAQDGVINQAAAQNVPVIAIAAQATTKYSVNLSANFTQLGYYGAAGLVNAMGGKPGSVLVVQAIAGQSFNQEVLAPGLAVLKACHETLVGNGSIFGQFTASLAKTQVLSYLSSHPATINGVYQVSAMAPGIISAFQQLGRTVPPTADLNPGAPSLLYWKQHASTYHGSGVAIVPLRTGEYAMAVGLAMLQGRHLKITDVPFSPPVITSANLSQWVEPGWTSSTMAQANGPSNSLPITQLIDGYFKK